MKINRFISVLSSKERPYFTLRGEDDEDNGIDVSDVDFAITVDIGAWIVGPATIEDEGNNRIHIGDIHLSVAVDIATQAFAVHK